MRADAYLQDPCGASSLPFWKTERMKIGAHMAVLRDDAYDPARCPGTDTRYFKCVHRLEALPRPELPAGYALVDCDAAGFARHIRDCYGDIGVDAGELDAYRDRPIYDGTLWLAVAEGAGGQIAASGIGELDRRIGEGILEWIQVSPAHRRRGLGRFVVCELLRRMQGRARFVTVSGRMDDPCRPLALYTACGFGEGAIWHVVRDEESRKDGA